MMNSIAKGLRGGQSAFTASRLPPQRGLLAGRRRSGAAGLRLQCTATKQLTPCKITGVGSAVPERVLTNADLESLVDTSDEWIATRTGIRKRHVLGKGESLTGLAAKASLRAIEMAGLQPTDIDMVLFATSTPEDIFGNACLLQAAIGAKGSVAFDLTAACSGFVVAMITAAQYVRTGARRNVLVVGADAMSRVVDWRDRTTCVLFGDGCGAVVLSANPDESAACCLMGYDMASDGAGHKSLNCPFSGAPLKPLSDSLEHAPQQHAALAAAAGVGGSAGVATAVATAPAPVAAAAAAGPGPSSHASYANISMNGQEVFKFAVRTVPAVIDAALASAGLAKEQVDWLVMHQANQRILDAAATRLGLPAERVVSNLANYGNTSAASIPLALDEAVRAGRIKPGDKLAMAGFGAGLTWAGAIVRWG